jgi:glutamate 5-kinase
MLTKLEAAALAKESGIPSVILNGERLEILYDLFENKATCTVFV